LDKTINCLETQAQLRPEDSDVYLTMGAFYAKRDMWSLALKAYMKGLEIGHPITMPFIMGQGAGGSAIIRMAWFTEKASSSTTAFSKAGNTI
jgi:hypothetical protein